MRVISSMPPRAPVQDLNRADTETESADTEGTHRLLPECRLYRGAAPGQMIEPPEQLTARPDVRLIRVRRAAMRIQGLSLFARGKQRRGQDGIAAGGIFSERLAKPCARR
jgi:hypothetical protein